MNNQLLFPESRRLSLSKINESDRTDQPTLNMLRQILDLNSAPQIGVLGRRRYKWKSPTVFAFVLHSMLMSLGTFNAIVGSLHSYSVIDIYDASSKNSKYVNDLLDNGATHVLRLSSYANEDSPPDKKLAAATWLLERSLLLKIFCLQNQGSQVQQRTP